LGSKIKLFSSTFKTKPKIEIDYVDKLIVIAMKRFISVIEKIISVMQ
jgi:hypothetical protein